MNKGYLNAFIAAIIASMLMGTLCIFVRESECTAQICSLSRFSIGLIIIGIYGSICVLLKRGSLKFSGKAFCSGIGISLCILFYFLAIQETSAGIAALLPATGPLFAAVWEALLEHHLPPKRDALLIMTAGLGIVLVSMLSESTGGGQNDALGIIYGLISGLFYSLYIVLNRFMKPGVTLLQRTFWQSAAGTIVLLIPVLCVLFIPAFQVEAPFENVDTGWIWLLGIGICQGVAVLGLVAFAMKKLSSLEFGIVSCMEPMEAAFIGLLMYEEIIKPGQWCGFALVLSAILAKSVLTRSVKTETPVAMPRDTYEEEYNERVTL